MVKRFIFFSLMIGLLYVGSVVFKVYENSSELGQKSDVSKTTEAAEEQGHKVYSFSFSKYATDGGKELEIDGDSADIFTRKVVLNNIIAKAYAEDQPVTLTADNGVFDKGSGKVFLEKNVVATTEDGARLITETLSISPQEKYIETESTAVVKKDNVDVKGDGASGDSQIKNVKFNKNVTVVISGDEDEGGNPGPSTTITCDGPLDIDYDKNIARFYDNVIATDKRGTLMADRMDVYYNKVTRGVAKIVATGNVIIQDESGNETYSDSVIYLAEEGRVILGGNTEALYFMGSDSEGLNGFDSVLGGSSKESETIDSDVIVIP